jgi:hypothetical protein
MAYTRVAVERRQFWGRQAELALVTTTLKGGSRIFYVHGLGGVGKSAFLRECGSVAVEAGFRVAHLDVRDIDASPVGLLRALGESLGTTEPFEALHRETALFLTIDSYESIAALDGWLRRTFFPQLPARTTVMMASRTAPAVDWTTDPEVEPRFRAIALRNLAAGESRALLSERHVPESQHASVLDFTHGHPLALVLVADVLAHSGGRGTFQPGDSPNVVRELLTRFVAGVPTASHRRALEMCSQVRVTTEALLAAVINDGDAHALFEWLRGLSFIDSGPEGLFPHDVVREVLDADFRWRDPDGYREIHLRVMQYLGRKISSTTGRAQQAVFFDKLFLHRASEIGRKCHDYTTLGSIYALRATDRDHPHIVELARRHEGSESADIAAWWLDRQPDGFRVIRGSDDEVRGFVASIDVRPADQEHDPAIRAACTFAHLRGRLREGDEMVHHRFHVDACVYQALSPVINVLATRATLAPLDHARLAWSFVAFADPVLWGPVMEYINFPRAQEADFVVGGRKYAVFAHDWRAEPFEAWWNRMGERMVTTLVPGEPLDDGPAQIAVLSKPEFEAAVRQALRDYTHPEKLELNPLRRSRLFVDDPSPARLQALLREALDDLKVVRRDEKFYRALLHTFFEPAATRELAAERLGLPFNTYRYQVGRGTERVVEWLWRRELGR